MPFKHDQKRSESSLDKRGIDFEEAGGMWLDPARIEYGLECGGKDGFAVIVRLADCYESKRGRATA